MPELTPRVHKEYKVRQERERREEDLSSQPWSELPSNVILAYCSYTPEYITRNIFKFFYSVRWKKSHASLGGRDHLPSPNANHGPNTDDIDMAAKI